MKSIKDIYELIKEKRANAIKDMSSKGVLSIDNPCIRELKGEIDAYYDIQTLIESSGLLDENANAEVEGRAKTVLEEINKALSIQRYEQECLVRNFRLVKVILPTSIMKELEEQSSKVKIPNLEKEGMVATVMSVPVEEDKYATRIRYVIEGDLKVL